MKDLKPLQLAVTEAKAAYDSKQAKADSLSQSASEATKTAKSADEKTAAQGLKDEASAAQGDANIAKKALDDAQAELDTAKAANETEEKQAKDKADADKKVADQKAKQEAHIAEVFKKNPKVQVVYATKDLKDVFIDKNFALLHKRNMRIDFTVVTRPAA